MKRMHRFAGLCVVVALCLGFAPESNAATEEEMLAAAAALDKRFIAAFNAGDAEAMGACYWNSSEAVTFPPDVLQARGVKAIKEGIKGMLAGMAGAKLVLTESHQFVAGDAVIGWGLWKVTMPGPEGTPIEMVGRYTDVKAEKDGNWVYVLDHASVPMPPPPGE